MVTLEKEMQKNVGVNDEFEKYLAKQRLSTTFNGLEVAEFSWYKKHLGIKD